MNPSTICHQCGQPTPEEHYIIEAGICTGCYNDQIVDNQINEMLYEN
jgi:formylmethanofuran dehydrogenase subunit E